MIRRAALLAVLLSVLSAPAASVEPDEILADPALENRARAISKQLRCLVCQNQSIDDSDAPLARDLRIVVRERLTAGASDDEVVRFVAERYGDFVLLSPPFKATTYALWLGPAAIFLVGAAAVAIFLRRRRAAAPGEEAALSAGDRARLDRLLGGDDAP
ncbi:MAG: cytochrome c-type biogenesis protein CcmH [Defluviicoccus sp.]|nr:cytochrome c-type biogenesis protein CcmH [Defluviicoccus sp.]MDE0274419.1 cytochrome c-type biogenesis protein CcmH [Defluviicoccus sp.]